MIRSTGYHGFIPKADAIAKRIKDRLEVTQKDLITLLDSTYVIVALSLDGWTSQNDISIFVVNGTWLNSNFKVYRACFDFC